MANEIDKIAAVVLTYNSASDLPECLSGLAAQQGVDIRIIVVDNASRDESRLMMEDCFQHHFPNGRLVDSEDVTPAMLNEAGALFMRHPQNDGYSAGNNIGARLAVKAGCAAVLIANPDVRISNPDYLVELWTEMRAIPDCLVAASRLVNLAGRDEHPLRATHFWEELLWIRQFGPRRFRPARHVRPPRGTEPVEAHKVHGACMLIRSSFLEQADFLDEAVFLYCEEPILAARVRAAGGRMLVFPKLKALHAHVASAKGNASRRMLLFIKSRLYYFETYKNYGPIKLAALRASYRVLAFGHRVKAWFGPA
jgi:GT2 family glycosyltransferase